MYRVINPKKIKKVRGERTRRQVVEASGGLLREQEIYAYENDKYKPTERTIPLLLKGLGCQFEDISDAVIVETV